VGYAKAGARAKACIKHERSYIALAQRTGGELCERRKLSPQTLLNPFRAFHVRQTG
jgi:hypothetical protein